MEDYYFQIALVVFAGLFSAVGTILIGEFKDINKSVKVMSESVNELNNKISVIIKDQEWHKEKIERLEQKLEVVRNV